MFDGFKLTTIETSEVTIRLRHGGSGPPLLLLHGFPQTHAMWSRIAPRLAERFTVVDDEGERVARRFQVIATRN